MFLIHPTAIIDPAAKIAPGVKIGPYCVIGLDVEIGEGTELESHVVVEGRTVIGPHCTVYPFAALGTAPQDLKYKGEKSTLTIGAHNIIREHVTMNPGTEGGGMETVVGDRCLFMVGAHVAHDCRIGNHVIMANNATLAGHVSVGDHALIGGLAAVHQFVRIGRHAVIGGMSGVEHDVIPYGSVIGERANLAGLNLIGMKRRGFSREEIHALRAAFRELFEGEAGTLDSRAEDIGEKHALFPAVTEVVDFVRADSKRQLCVPKTIDRIIDDAA